jgi:hypothetical protein
MDPSRQPNTIFSSSVNGFLGFAEIGAGFDFDFRTCVVGFLSASFEVGLTTPNIGDGSYVALSGSPLPPVGAKTACWLITR